MTANQDKSESIINSRRKSRSVSIPKPPSIPPPPIPASTSAFDIKEPGVADDRMRTASENILSSKSARMAVSSKDTDLGRRSVSFSRTRHPRSRTTTGKGILKKPKDGNDQSAQITQEALEDAREKCESRGRNPAKRKSSQKSSSDLSLDKKGRASVRKSVESLKKSQVVLPAGSEASKENASPATNQIPKENVKHSIFSHLGKTEADFVDRILKVHIHGADELITDVNVRNPLVRVSLIDTNTGKYLAKSKMERKVTSANESDYLSVILPALTQPYSFGTVQSSEPKWDEELVFNEDYLHILQPNIIIGFEILNLIKNRKLLSKWDTDGWNKIAWGFIKVIGKNGLANTEKKIRLQLYNYPWVFPWTKKPPGESDLLYAYKSARSKYPSTLYVNISGIPQMDVIKVKNRPRYPTEVETGRLTLNQMIKGLSGKKSGGLSRSLININSTEQWRYKKGHPFKLPNKVLYGIDCGTRGAFSCSFSNSGLYIAIACVGPNTYPIKVYDTFNGERIATLEGHQDLVYQMSWSLDDSELISASSDSTVRIWSFDISGAVFNVGNISHSSYIYASIYHPLFCNDKKIILTAGYDGYIRSWEYNIKAKLAPECTNTILGHKGYINSLLFDDDGQKLYSADSIGYIKVWDASIDEELQPSFKCITSVDIFYGISISHLSIHSPSRKFLVQTSSNTLHVLDSRILKVLTHIDPMPKPYFKKNILGPALPPLPNPMHSLFRRSQFSPCGTYILSGAAVYETDSGKKAGVYDSHGTVIDVAWHPNDFMCCLVEYGSCRTHIYTYDASFKPLKKNPQPEPLKKSINEKIAENDRMTPLKPSVSENYLKALTQLKLGEELFISPKLEKFDGRAAKTAGI